MLTSRVPRPVMGGEGRLATVEAMPAAASPIAPNPRLPDRPAPRDPPDPLALGLEEVDEDPTSARPFPGPLDACPTPDASDLALEARIRVRLGPAVGHYGVVVHHLACASEAAVHPDRPFESASLFKLGVMHEVFRQREAGQIRFDEVLTITAAAAAEDLGTLRTWGAIGQRVSVARLLEQMITISDNSAAVMLAGRVGWHRIDPSLAPLGLSATHTLPPFRTTARDMAVLLRAIAQGAAVSAAASAEMEALLLRQQIRDRIPAGLPAGVPVGNKTGNLPDATHDVAIVYAPSGTYVLAVLSDRPWSSAPIAALSQEIYAHYESGASASPGEEPRRP